MRVLASIAVVVVLFAVAISSALVRTADSAPGGGRITVTATVSDSSFGPAGFVRLLQIWNRAKSSRPIGHAWLTCEGLMLRGVDECSLALVMKLGKVTAFGPVHSLRTMYLVVTGGSRLYQDTRGGTVSIHEDPFQDDYVLNFRLG